MTAHLLLLTIGPVQDFIQQARRTRDLWYGSHLLSELSRAAARSLADADAQLVFPALPRGHAELALCITPLRAGDQPPLNIANRILAEIPEGADPEALARTAREDVRRHWRDQIAAPVKRACARLLADGVEAVWDEQIDTLLELTAAWAPLGDYTEARRLLDRAIAARKHLRDFAPWQQLRGGVPKSSLDGARETVLARPERRAAKLVKKYRITAGEQLDAVALVKRAGGDPTLGQDDDVDRHVIQFVPVVNVALAPWASLAAQETPAQLGSLKDACGRLGLPRVNRRIPCAEAFPYDATIFLSSRWASVFEERGLKPEPDPQRWGSRHVGPLFDALSEPYPYVACLVADGDHMGRAIERIHTAGQHRDFSCALSSFAGEARRIVEQQHLGSLVYAGGDDVLAFVPLTHALACADALRREFACVMAQACPPAAAGEAEAELPTLSVGLGVGHVMESMGELLAIGRTAEKLAKGADLPEGDRNALAIVVDKRSGGRISWRSRWTAWNGNPVARLTADAKLLEGDLSSRKVYEIARTLARLPQPADLDVPDAPDAQRVPDWSTVLTLEVRRALARTHAGEAKLERGEGGLSPDQLGLSLDRGAAYDALHRDVDAWIQRMLVARVFAAAAPRSRKQPGKEEAA